VNEVPYKEQELPVQFFRSAEFSEGFLFGRLASSGTPRAPRCPSVRRNPPFRPYLACPSRARPWPAGMTLRAGFPPLSSMRCSFFRNCETRSPLRSAPVRLLRNRPRNRRTARILYYLLHYLHPPFFLKCRRPSTFSLHHETICCRELNEQVCSPLSLIPFFRTSSASVLLFHYGKKQPSR